MKTVVITGSARGLGFEMAKEFRKNNIATILSLLLQIIATKCYIFRCIAV